MEKSYPVIVSLCLQRIHENLSTKLPGKIQKSQRLFVGCDGAIGLSVKISAISG
jgi:hypothetical protein